MYGACVEGRRQLSVLLLLCWGSGSLVRCWALPSRRPSPWAKWPLSVSHLAAEKLGLQIHGTDKPSCQPYLQCLCACVFIYVTFSYICVKAHLSCELALSFSMWGLSSEYLWSRPAKQMQSFWGAAALTFSSTEMLAILLHFGAKCFDAQSIWP